MNARKLFSLSLFVAISLAAFSCAPGKGFGLGGGVAGSGNIKTETRHTGAFEAITVEYPADITIQQGAEDIVWIQADDNLIPQVITEIASGRLTIKTEVSDWKSRVNPSQPVKIAITAKNPKEIVLASPVGTLQVNDLKAGKLKLVLSGGGQVKATGIQVDMLETLLTGAGDIQVAGAADEIKVVLSGWGNFDAAELKSKKATIDLTGAGDVTVHAETALVATVKGAGSVKYYGNPRVEQTITGSGSIKPAGQDN